MNSWQKFLDSLNTDGGHIFLLLCLAVALTLMHGQSVEKFQGEVVGGLLVALRGGRPQIGG
jgi:hypothetical protein